MTERRADNEGCRLAALGIANALGNNPAEVWSRLVEGDTSHFVRRTGLAPERNILVGWNGSGMSVMEMSHRGKEFIGIAERAEADLR